MSRAGCGMCDRKDSERIESRAIVSTVLPIHTSALTSGCRGGSEDIMGHPESCGDGSTDRC